MRDPSPLLLVELWRRVAGLQCAREFAPLRGGELSWVVQTGMAPLLFDFAQPEHLPGELRARLRAADRWARLRYADSIAATHEILDGYGDRAEPLTLLKGLSIGSERYPSPHHRFLGDLDLLVPPGAIGLALEVLQRLGYAGAESAIEAAGDHHHLPPLQHPESGVWVELHTDLLPAEHGLSSAGPLSLPVVLAERCPSELDGRSVFRLSRELQVIYIASHWALDFIPAAGPRALLDMLLLLTEDEACLDWGRIVGWLDNPRISAHLQLMLSCLASWELLEIPSPLGEHWQQSAVLEPQALEVLVGMVERYQVRGAMANIPELRGQPAPHGPEHPHVPPTGTLRSRVETLRATLSTRNFRGLLPIFDSIPWRVLLEPGPSLRRRLLILWCRIFPPGDPDRFVPGGSGQGTRLPGRLPS